MQALPSPYRVRLVVLSLALISAGSYALACGDSGDAGGGASTGGDGGGGTLPEASIGKTDAGAPASTMRLAHVAADLGPVDFCYRAAKGTSFEGPVLGGGIGDPRRDASAEAGDDDDGSASDDAGSADDADGGGDGGGASAVGYRTVSRYLTLDASGPLTIALIAPGATSCATPLFTADVTLDPGKLSTVAIVGLAAVDGGDAALALVAFTDDGTTTTATARVRMIHAALGGPGGRAASGALSVRASASQTVTVADHVEPKKAATSSAAVPVDSLGYATIAPVPSPAQLAVGAAAMSGPATPDAATDSWVSQAGELDLNGSSLHTGFILTGEDQQPFEVLWCTDTSTSGDLTTCVRVR